MSRNTWAVCADSTQTTESFFFIACREAYRVNVLTPIVEIANRFMDSVYGTHFELQIFAEYPVKLAKSAQQRMLFVLCVPF